MDHVWDESTVWRDLPLRHVTNAWLRASATVQSDGKTPDNQHFSYLAQYAAQRMRMVNPDVPVASDKLVGSPTQIRYGWQNAPVNPNLYNGAGLPAPTFLLDVEGVEVNPRPCNILSPANLSGPEFDY